jgi:hypothetical protein
MIELGNYLSVAIQILTPALLIILCLRPTPDSYEEDEEPPIL